MSYPRSKLFRNYEAQQISMSKSYPRSRLFTAYEASKVKMISAQELSASKNKEQEHQLKNPVNWEDEEEEMNFNGTLSY